MRDARRLAVRVEEQWKDVGKDASVGRIGAAVIDRDQRHLVGGDAVDHGVGDADRKRVPGGGAGMRPLALVAFDAALDLVLGLALIPDELDAVDAAVTGIDQVHVVDEPAEIASAAGGIGSDAIALQRKVLLVGVRGGYGGDKGERSRRRHRAYQRQI
jgi:hypothetical protein